MIELAENVTCRRFSDLVYLKLISKLFYWEIICRFMVSGKIPRKKAPHEWSGVGLGLG